MNVQHTHTLEEGGPLERTSVTLPRRLFRQLRQEARSTRRPASGIVRDALETYFSQKPPPSLPAFTGIGASGRKDTSKKAEELIAKRMRVKDHG